jgi:hypothetical protein
MALPQYASWEIYEITEENLPDICDELNVDDDDGIIDKLRRTLDALPGHMTRCEGIFRSQYQAPLAIGDIISYNNGNMNTRFYIVIDIVLKYPVAFFSIDVGNPLTETLFRYSNIDPAEDPILALGVFVHWTCSFTQSRVECENGIVMADHYAATAATHKINVANYVTDGVANLLLDDLNDMGIEINDEEIEFNNVIFYSIGIEGARERHRKNGKLSACRFMYEWRQVETNDSLPVIFNQPSYENTMYYFYIRNGPSFNESDLKQHFINDGSDISAPNGTYEEDDPDYFNDENFSCPQGPINEANLANHNANNNMVGGRRSRKTNSSRRRRRSRRRKSRRFAAHSRRPNK